MAVDTTYTTNFDPGYTSTASDSASAAAMMAIFGVIALIYLVIGIVTIVSMWKLYSKAHKPGWAALVPIYNVIVMLEIIGRPLWWVALLFVPILNIWISIVIAFDLAKAYGKSTGFGVLVWLLPVIGYMVLAFSKSAQYVGPVAAGVDGLGFAPDRPAAMSTTPGNGAPAATPVAPAFAPAAPPVTPVVSSPENVVPTPGAAPVVPSDPGQPTPPQQ